MNKEDFVLDGCYYQTEVDDVLIKIHKDSMNKNTVGYANKIFELYFYKKSEILEYVLNYRVLDFYGGSYKKNEIVEKIKEADIEIINERWGYLTWRNHDLDEHIIQVEFNDEMQLSYVSIDG